MAVSKKKCNFAEKCEQYEISNRNSDIWTNHRRGYSYVDKTTLVYQLAHYAKNQFLSRPRGFGKSLLVYTIFAMLGADVSPELPTSDGRIDLVLKTVDCIFIFELKYGKDAVTAINQIEEKKYFSAFADDKRKKFLVGINFSDDSRTIDDWTVIGG